MIPYLTIPSPMEELEHRNRLGISYKIYGRGDPVLCIHGLNLDKKMFYQSDLHKQFEGKKIIAIDLPGYGRSKMIEPFTIESICERIIQTMEELKIECYSICGYCMGGIFALYIASLYPERVRKLYLYETMLIYPFWMNLCKTRIFEWGYNLANRTNLANILSVIPPLKEFGNKKRMFFCDRKWHRVINKIYLDLFHQIEFKNYDTILRELDISCQIVIATNTYHQIFTSASLLQQTLKKTSLIIIRDKGHLFFL